MSIQATASQLAAGLWCVYDHHINGDHIYTGCCRIDAVYVMTEARNNTAWQTVTASDQPITISIVALGNKIDMMRQSAARIRERRPYCNINGFNAKGAQKRIKCSNGVTYNSQLDAAKALGINQSQISRHLRGEFTHVKGLQFTWA